MADAEEAEAEEEGGDEAVAKAAAEAEKKLGTEAYKKRDFATAIPHFDRAWETWPKDVTFLTNLGGGWFPYCSRVRRSDVCTHRVYICAAAYFEQGEYDKSIEACQKAVDEGRDVSSLF